MKQVYKTPEEFKAVLKVGDFVQGWQTTKTVQISALGEKDRFLAVDVYGQETVHTMTQSAGWLKVEQPYYWEDEEL